MFSALTLYTNGLIILFGSLVLPLRSLYLVRVRLIGRLSAASVYLDGSPELVFCPNPILSCQLKDDLGSISFEELSASRRICIINEHLVVDHLRLL